MKIELEISEKQYNVLIRSLDLYARFQSFQTNVLFEEFLYNGYNCNENITDEDIKKISKNIIDIYSDLNIKSTTNMCENSKIAYELYCHFRYKSGLEQKHSVYKQEPLKYSKELKPIITFKS